MNKSELSPESQKIVRELESLQKQLADAPRKGVNYCGVAVVLALSAGLALTTNAHAAVVSGIYKTATGIKIVTDETIADPPATDTTGDSQTTASDTTPAASSPSTPAADASTPTTTTPAGSDTQSDSTSPSTLNSSSSCDPVKPNDGT